MGKVRSQGLAQDHRLVLEISAYLSKVNRLFFIKATKAAGQGGLSKFEAVECSKIGHSWAVSNNHTSTVSTCSGQTFIA